MNQLIFEDNFNNLNTTRWTVLEQFSSTPVIQMFHNNISKKKKNKFKKREKIESVLFFSFFLGL